MKKKLYGLIGMMTLFTLVFAGCSSPAKEEVKDPGSQPEVVKPEETPKPQEDPVIKDLSDIFSKTEDFKKDGIHYTQLITAADQKTEMETWIKGDLIKSRISAQGEEIITITDNKSGDFITYYPSQKSGIKYNIKSSSTAALPEGAILDIESYEDDIDPVNFEILGREKINGIDTVVIKTKNDGSEDESKIWVSEKYGVMMKMEASDKDGSQMTIEVKDFEAGGVSDSEFDVPSDVTLQEF